jgi:hypothetical protein
MPLCRARMTGVNHVVVVAPSGSKPHGSSGWPAYVTVFLFAVGCPPVSPVAWAGQAVRWCGVPAAVTAGAPLMREMGLLARGAGLGAFAKPPAVHNCAGGRLERPSGEPAAEFVQGVCGCGEGVAGGLRVSGLP